MLLNLALRSAGLGPSSSAAGQRTALDLSAEDEALFDEDIGDVDDDVDDDELDALEASLAGLAGKE
jgi:hypothetical protein